MDIALVEEQTIILVNLGHRVFQIHRFAESEREHVGKLAEWADFDDSASVIDLGCGTGEVAKLMNEYRPDLEFTLVNISFGQLEYAPYWMRKIHCDFCHVPELSASYSGAMFCFSIGHSDIDAALKEAYRLLKKYGVLFIYDMVRVSGSNDSMREVDYVVLTRDEMAGKIKTAGFEIDFYLEPFDSGDYGRSVLGESFDQVFDGTIPAIWRLVK